MRRTTPLLALLLPLPAFAADNDMAAIAAYFLGSLLIAVLVFLMFREVLCWYWKINEGLGLLREIRDGLETLNRAPAAAAGPDAAAPAPGDAPELDRARSRLGMQSSDLLARAYNTPSAGAGE